MALLITIVYLSQNAYFIFRDRIYLFLSIPIILQSIFLSVGTYSYWWTSIEFEFLYTFIILISLLTSYFRFKLIQSFSVSQEFETLLIQFKDKVLILRLFLLLLILYLYFVFGSEAWMNSRSNYEALIEQNRNGGILWSLLGFITPVFNAVVHRFDILILVILVVWVLGSKGYTISVALSFISLRFMKIKRRKELFSVILLALIISFGFIQYLKLNIKGVDNLWHYLVYGYFDYGRNIQAIIHEIGFLPMPWKYSGVVFNNVIIGFSRLTELERLDLFRLYFPYEISLGKAPGLLMVEDLLRVGFIFYPFLQILKYIILFFYLKIFHYLDRRFLFLAFIIPLRFLIVYSMFLFISKLKWKKKS